MSVQTTTGAKEIPFHLKRGIFQGDSLSPLLFCLSTAAISHALRKRRSFTSLHQPAGITHLFFVDDLKVYVVGKEALVDTLAVVEEVSGAVGMSLGLIKCATVHARSGKVRPLGPINLPSGETMHMGNRTNT